MMKSKSIYIHIPFCSHKCLFCSFAIVVGQINKVNEYLDKLEIQANEFSGTTLDTLYIGGGTPSLLSQEQLGRLMKIINHNFHIKSNSEITIEANPEGLDLEKAQCLKDLGFNRISLGVQSLNDRYLKFLGRRHDSFQARAAYDLLRKAGFMNINLDLMYAFPGQTQEELVQDVHAIASLGSEHLSLYTLTIEPNSRFHVQAIKLDEEEKIAKQYQTVIDVLQGYGFKQYEVSNFSKEGFESKHNKNYWLGGRYIALGMGAHGFKDNQRYWHTSKFQDYLNNKNTIESYEDLSDETLLLEKLVFGLRMNEGVSLNILPNSKKDVVNDLIDQGFLIIEKDRLKVTDQGRLILDELSARLV